jgi:hypothetical protein
MALRDVPLVTKAVDINGVPVEVRGLSYSDLATILPKYGSEVGVIFGSVLSGQELDVQKLPSIIQLVLSRCPDLCAEVIAIAADDPSPEGIARAKKISFGKQTELLEAIFDCTFTTESEMEKFLGVIERAVLALAKMMDRVTLSNLSVAGGFQSASRSVS